MLDNTNQNAEVNNTEKTGTETAAQDTTNQTIQNTDNQQQADSTQQTDQQTNNQDMDLDDALNAALKEIDEENNTQSAETKPIEKTVSNVDETKPVEKTAEVKEQPTVQPTAESTTEKKYNEDELLKRAKEIAEETTRKLIEENNRAAKEKLDKIEFKQGLISMKNEISAAVSSHPTVKSRDILLAIEEGDERPAEDIAKDIEIRYNNNITELHKKWEDEFLAKLKQEKTGSTTVQQQQASESSSSTSGNDTDKIDYHSSRGADNEWFNALRESKASMGQNQ